MRAAVNDYRALCLLDSLIGREATPALRGAINTAIENALRG